MNKHDIKRLELLKRAGFQFGSVRFGCDNPRNEDWVIPFKSWQEIIGTELGSFYYTNGDYRGEEDGQFLSFYLDYKGTKYNFIIPYEKEVFRAYKIATKLMLRIPLRYIQNKNARVYLFQAFREIVLNPDGELIPAAKYQKYDSVDDDDVPF